jgi:O-acetyl-ADP-ribose deacetylase (regulator of RNase III)
VATSAGRLPFKAIIHVAGIGLLWRASQKSIQDSTRNALEKATELGMSSVAMPLIGAGTGGVRPADVEAWMSQAVTESAFLGEVVIVRYRRD